MTERTPPAPWTTIPPTPLITIEHPAAIKNLPAAIATVGGEKALSKLAATHGASGLDLRFRPDDIMQPPIQSRTVDTCNILLKITILRSASGGGGEEKTLLQRLKDSRGQYSVEAVGLVDKTVRFREMANYQFNTSRVGFVARLRDGLVGADFEKLRKFELDPGRGYQPDLYILPPPTFSSTGIQHNYYYRQNPAIKKALVAGKPTLLNLQAAPKTLTPMVHISNPTIPTKPMTLPPYQSLDRNNRECVDTLRSLFAQRPIWTRRALFNHFPKNLQSLVRFSMAHVGYMWRAGPWRDTCVLYGIDPRSDPEYRMYQSVFFQVETHNAQRTRPGSGTHVFDGKTLVKDGRCFQLCDVTDPLVRRLIEAERIRRVCDVADGWYRTGTMRKIKAVMRMKIRALAEGVVMGDREFLGVLEWESGSEEEGEDGGRGKRRRRKGKGGEGGKEVEEVEVEEVEEADEAEGEGEGEGDWEVELDVVDPLLARGEPGDGAGGREVMMEVLRQGGEHAGYEGFVGEGGGVDGDGDGDGDGEGDALEEEVEVEVEVEDDADDY